VQYHEFQTTEIISDPSTLYFLTYLGSPSRCLVGDNYYSLCLRLELAYLASTFLRVSVFLTYPDTDVSVAIMYQSRLSPVS